MPVLPSREEFPYAIRQVSEAIGSNGSTSMGSVCASTLSLLAAGVPLKAPVAGIAMGLVSGDVDGQHIYKTLTDILGAEDAFGDMDFKVAGTSEFITALQLDTKLDGIPADILASALQQAKEARTTILEVINECIDGPAEMSPYAPRIITTTVPVDKIGEVIGPKGKMINQIQEDTAPKSPSRMTAPCTSPPKAARREKAKEIIDQIANPHVPEAGETYNGKVVKTTSFGAFVNLTPAPTVCCTSPRSATSPTASASTPSKTCSRKATPLRWSCRVLTIAARSRWPSRASRIRNPPLRVVTVAIAMTAVAAVAVVTTAVVPTIAMIVIMMIVRVAVVPIAMTVTTIAMTVVPTVAVVAVVTTATRVTPPTRTTTSTVPIAKSAPSVRVAACAATLIRSKTDVFSRILRSEAAHFTYEKPTAVFRLTAQHSKIDVFSRILRSEADR